LPSLDRSALVALACFVCPVACGCNTRNTITNALPCGLFSHRFEDNRRPAWDFFALDPGVLQPSTRASVWWRCRACLNRPSGMEYGSALWVGAARPFSMFHRWLSGRELDRHVGYADDLCAVLITPLFVIPRAWGDMSTGVATIESQNGTTSTCFPRLSSLRSFRCWLGLVFGQPHIWWFMG